MLDLSISIVLYKNDEQELQRLLNCIYSTSLSYKIYLIDNSPDDNLKCLSKTGVEYIFNNKNLGFGKAHNIALRKSIDQSLYHLVLNPDIEFEVGTLDRLFAFMQLHKDVGQLLPKVFYKNGELQKLCHLLPQPLNLISRRFFEQTRWAKKMNDKYELDGFGYDKCLNIPNLSGCFMFLRCSVLKQSGLFDERYFMYMEDIDLCRRIHSIAKTVFVPDVSVIHGFEKESYTNKIVLNYHIRSAIKYFNKWGWIFDKKRSEFNRRILREIDRAKYTTSYLKPRLLILTNRLVVGGISNDIIPLAYYLLPYLDTCILYGEKEKDETETVFLLKKYPGLHFKKIKQFKKTINPLIDLLAYFQIRREIKSFKADIIHTHGAKSGFLGRIAACHTKVPVIIHTFHGHHFHSYYNWFISAALIKLEKLLGRFTTIVIAISACQKKELTDVYNIVSSEKVKTITLGIEPEKIRLDPAAQRFGFRKRYKIDDDTIAIGIVGRIVPVKNLKLFVQVAKDLITCSTKRLCFFIIGDGFLKNQVEEQCGALNMHYTEKAGENADIIFTSWIEDIIPAIHAMDIVTLTSNNEGTPMSLIEAQFCGKPVVATNVGGVKDVVLDNETGFLVNVGDAAALAEKLKLLIENEVLRREMGVRAEAFAEENFSKQEEVEKYKRLYQDLLTPKNIRHSLLQHA